MFVASLGKCYLISLTYNVPLGIFGLSLSGFLVSEFLKFYITELEVSGVTFNLGADSAECFVAISTSDAQILSQCLLCATVSIIQKAWMLGSSFARVN